MITATISSQKKTQPKPNPAKWDEEKTRVLLEIFVEEMNSGNRPSGIYSKRGWLNIIVKFNAKTGLGYSKKQLKNRQDNLRREYTKWVEKAKLDPTILRYKDGGPIHLDLLQKIFGGTTSNGFSAYIPNWPDDVLNNEGFDETQDSTPPATHSQSATRLRSWKRQRDSSSERIDQSDQLTAAMGSLIETIREYMIVLQRVRAEEETEEEMEEETLTYGDALDLLKGLPEFSYDDPIYWKCVRILENKTRRIAFRYIIMKGGGATAILRWLNTFPDM